MVALDLFILLLLVAFLLIIYVGYKSCINYEHFKISTGVPTILDKVITRELNKESGNEYMTNDIKISDAAITLADIVREDKINNKISLIAIDPNFDMKKEIEYFTIDNSNKETFKPEGYVDTDYASLKRIIKKYI